MCNCKNIIYILITISTLLFILRTYFKPELECNKSYPLNGKAKCSFLYSKFEGNFIDSKRNGYGEYEGAFATFRGNYVNEKKEGKGTFKFLKSWSSNEGLIEGY